MSDTRIIVVLGELLNNDQREALIKDLVKGFLLFSSLSAPLEGLLKQDPIKESDYVFTYKNEEVILSVLYRLPAPAFFKTLSNLLTVPAKSNISFQVYLIYAGLFANGSGHWVLPDCVFSPTILSIMLKEMSAAYANSLDVDQKSAQPFDIFIGLPGGVGEWRQLTSTTFKSIGGRSVHISVSSSSGDASKAKSTTGDATGTHESVCHQFVTSHLQTVIPINYVESFDSPIAVRHDQSRKVQVTKPCLYVFPEGSGQASVFSLPDYHMLINAGCAHRPNFWPVVCHFERLDSILLTHWGVDNIFGLNAVLPILTNQKQSENSNQSVVCLLTPPPSKWQSAKPTCDGLGFNLPAHVSQLMDECSSQHLVHYPLSRGSKMAVASKPIALYQKVGHGRLEMFPLTPTDDDVVELRKLTEDWSKAAASSLLSAQVALSKSATGTSGKCSIPLLSHTSLSVLVLWHPVKESESTLRLLFASPIAHQTRVLVALEAVVSSIVCLRHWAPKSSTEQERKRLARTTTKPRQTTAALSNGSSSVHSTSSMKTAPSKNVKTTQRPTSSKAKAEQMTKQKTKGSGQPVQEAIMKGNKSSNNAAPPPESGGDCVGNDEVLASLENGSVQSGHPELDVECVEQHVDDTAIEKVDVVEDWTPPPESGGYCLGDGGTLGISENGFVQSGHPELDVECAEQHADFSQPDGVPTEAIENVDAVGNWNPPPESGGYCLGDGGALAILENGFVQSGHPELDVQCVGQNPDISQPVDFIREWGEPQNLPLPNPPKKTVANGHRSTQSTASAKRPNSGQIKSAPSYSPGYSVASGYALTSNNAKQAPYDKVKPLYVDVAFVPGGGNPQLVDAEFFKRVRARYYVATDCRPTCHLLEALTVGKESWTGDDSAIASSLLLSHETDDVIFWLGSNAGRLTKCHLNVCAVMTRSHIKLIGADDVATDFPGFRIDF